MTFKTKDRYGGQDFYEDGEAPRIAEELLRSLETEEFEEPDNEHTQVAVSREGWAVTVNVSGLVTLSDLRNLTGKETDSVPPELYVRATSRAEVKDILIRIAKGDIAQVLNLGWVPLNQVPPFREELFRKQASDG